MEVSSHGLVLEKRSPLLAVLWFSFTFLSSDIFLPLDSVWAVDVSADGRVLVSADYSGLVAVTDLTTKTMLWSMQMDGAVFTLRIHNSVVFVPIQEQFVYVLDVMTGDVLRRYPALSGMTHGLAVIPGKRVDNSLIV